MADGRGGERDREREKRRKELREGAASDFSEQEARETW
jgi:hypothetical protein